MQIFTYSSPTANASVEIDKWYQDFQKSPFIKSDTADVRATVSAIHFGRCTGRDPGVVTQARCTRALHSVADYVSLPLIDLQVGIRIPLQPLFATTPQLNTYLDDRDAAGAAAKRQRVE